MKCSQKASFTASALFLKFALLSRDVVQFLHLKRFALKRPRVLELDDKKNAVRPPTISEQIGLLLQDHWPLGYRAEVSQRGFLQSPFVKRR